MSFERPNIQAMHGYEPGEQPLDASVIKLNTNENPYPPPAAVMQRLGSILPEQLRRYPDPMSTQFRRTAAQIHGVDENQVIATNAGDELLRLAITTFVEPGRPIGTLDPSYSLYPVLAEIHGSPVERIGLDENWNLPTDLADRWNRAGVRLGFAINPHAPTGKLRAIADLLKLAENFHGVLLVDEAYVDFVDPSIGHDSLELVRRCPNVLLLRTLSKGYSLAGLRFGYGLGQAALIAPMLTKTKDSYNTDAIAQQLATAALLAREEARQTWERVRSERSRLKQTLDRLGLPSPESQSNFLLAQVPPGRLDARSLYEKLKGRGVLVRYFDQDRLRDRLRITVGTPQQNSRLIEELTALLQ